VKLAELEIPGAFAVDIEAAEDERGFFARTWCEREFAAAGLVARIAQVSVSWNRSRGTLRGLHYQADPFAEAKLIRCTRGRIYDVLLDLRPGSPAYRRWVALELSATSHRSVYAPPGVAHGFQTLEDDTEVTYHISEFHRPEAARGARWNDPAFGIRWPEPVTVISDRDRGYPDFA
jgi:dTDP-4-dehydrorhamnose 3,5-epimerase